MSISSRAYRILCSRYRMLLGRDRAAKDSIRGRDDWRCLESLEPRVLLSGSPVEAVLADYVVFGEIQAVVEKNSAMTKGLLGSNGDVSVGKHSTTQAIAGGGSLDLDKKSLVQGEVLFNGAVVIGKESLLEHDLDAGDGVTIEKHTTINGEVTSAAAVGVGANVTVLGGIVEFGSPSSFTTVTMPSPTVIVTDPDNDVETDPDTTVTLAPGHYGDLDLGKNNELNLSAGEYHFDLIAVDKNLQLNLDLSNGEISVFVAGDVMIEKNLDVELIGGVAEDVFFEIHGHFMLEKNSDWMGTVFAPTGSVGFANNTILIGAAYSGTTIHVDKNSVLTLAPASRLTGLNDTDPPVITLELANDTGASSSSTLR